MASTPKKLKPLLTGYNLLAQELQEYIQFLRTENQKTVINPDFDNQLNNKLTHIHKANSLLTDLYNKTIQLINLKVEFVRDMQVQYEDDDTDTTVIATFVKYSEDYNYCVINWVVGEQQRSAFIPVRSIKHIPIPPVEE